MAKATKTTKMVEQVVTKMVPTTEVTLVLTQEEAQALVNVLAKIGGEPAVSERGQVQNIGDTLRDAGFHFNCDRLSGGIYCHATVEEADRRRAMRGESPRLNLRYSG